MLFPCWCNRTFDHVMHIHILWNSTPWNIDVQEHFVSMCELCIPHKIMGHSHLGIWGSWNGEWHYHARTITKSISNIIMNTLKCPSMIGFLMISGGWKLRTGVHSLDVFGWFFFLYTRVLVARYHFQLSSWEFHDFNNYIQFHDQRVRLNWIELKFTIEKKWYANWKRKYWKFLNEYGVVGLWRKKNHKFEKTLFFATLHDNGLNTF